MGVLGQRVGRPGRGGVPGLGQKLGVVGGIGGAAMASCPLPLWGRLTGALHPGASMICSKVQIWWWSPSCLKSSGFTALRWKMELPVSGPAQGSRRPQDL